MITEKYLYLFVDFLTLVFPLLFSFYSKANFSLKWKYVWPAILIPATLFIAWDIWFTSMDVWGFNNRYVMGVYLFNLPLEEVLFFICIPYACLFTYEAVNHYEKREIIPNQGARITWVLILGLMVVAIDRYQQWYTFATCSLLAIALLLNALVFKPAFMGKFYLAFLFILIPFFIVNGILTGTGLDEPVVWYDNHENLGIRIGTIPFEDTFYGMLLILMNVSIFEYLQKRSSRTT